VRCIRPLSASQNSAGDVVYSSRKALAGLVGFELPCRKCLPCRLEQAREKAIRCFHESMMHEDNIFLTLTYDDAHLESPWLLYQHFQKFMKDLRERLSRDVRSKDEAHISFMVTGEYGDKNKRPHWHALVFNYSPEDCVRKYVTELGEQVYSSGFLTDLWGRGMVEFGSVTLESANYVARYAAKKLVHGKDEEHEFHPIHKTSKGRAIGRSWIEKNWKFVFENGFVVLPSGSPASIPRYYVDWLKKHEPAAFARYVSGVRLDLISKAEKSARKEELEFLSNVMNFKSGDDYPLRRVDVKVKCLERKFKVLQERLKL